jgi:hypothetical protein
MSGKPAIVRVEFIDVGREKRTWFAHLSNLTMHLLTECVRNSGALRSRDIHLSAPDDDTGEGLIFAGFHTVGRYRIIPPIR